MQYSRLTAAPTRLMPFAALLVATALGGCIGYAEHPSHGYGYNHPSGYYAGYPRADGASHGYRPYYSPDYQRSGDTYQGRGGVTY